MRKALCDPLEEVREAAAKTFEQLHTTIGHQALDDILPTLLKQLVRGRRRQPHGEGVAGGQVVFGGELMEYGFVRTMRRQQSLLLTA